MTGPPSSPGGAGPRRALVELDVLGPWSLSTSRRFWEGFAPAALPETTGGASLETAFLVEADWSRARAEVTQDGGTARITVSGDGDLHAAAAQVASFLSLDVDARSWPAVAGRDPVMADAQERLPGLRPCGFHSPYEAAAWAVLSQRVRMTQAARTRQELVARYGADGAFPAPEILRRLDADLPGRKVEYLHAVAEAALEGRLGAAALRALPPAVAIREVQEVKGLGPFAAELVVLRGANVPDWLPTHERRLDALVVERYGSDRSAADIARAWQPFRTWAAVHLRALLET